MNEKEFLLYKPSSDRINWIYSRAKIEFPEAIYGFDTSFLYDIIIHTVCGMFGRKFPTREHDDIFVTELTNFLKDGIDVAPSNIDNYHAIINSLNHLLDVSNCKGFSDLSENIRCVCEYMHKMEEAILPPKVSEVKIIDTQYQYESRLTWIEKLKICYKLFRSKNFFVFVEGKNVSVMGYCRADDDFANKIKDIKLKASKNYVRTEQH